MNLTAISLTLIWNSPFYCICTNVSDYKCTKGCSGFGPILHFTDYLSLFKALRDNINTELTFTIVGFDNMSYGFNFSRYKFNQIFQKINFRSGTNETQKIGFTDECATKFLKKKALFLDNINLVISSSDNLIDEHNVDEEEEFSLDLKELVLINSSIVLNSPTLINIQSKIFSTDFNTLRSIGKQISTYKFRTLKVHLMCLTNVISLSNSTLELTNSTLNEIEIYKLPPSLSINLSDSKCKKLHFIQDYYINDMESNPYLTLQYCNSSISILCDFSQDNTKQISFEVMSNYTNLIDFLYLRFGNSTLNIIDRGKNDTMMTQTFSPIETTDNAIETDYVELNPTDPPNPQSEEKTFPGEIETNDYPFSPFFLLEGSGDIFINYQYQMILNLNQFVINDDTENETLFKSIAVSPFKNITILIDYQNKTIDNIKFPSSLFFKRSFNIINCMDDPIYVTLEKANFSNDTIQSFSNVIVVSESPSLAFKELRLCRNATIENDFSYKKIEVDLPSLCLEKFNDLKETIEITVNDDRRNFILCTNGTLFFNIDEENETSINLNNKEIINEIYFKISGSISIVFSPEEFRIPKTVFLISEYTNITLIGFSKNIYLLDFLTIQSSSYKVDVFSDFDFPSPNPVTVLGDLNVSFNNNNILFPRSYCVCQDNEEVNCVGVCSEEYGPILPFDEGQISNTVRHLPISFASYSVIGTNLTKNPFFDYALFNATSFNIISMVNTSYITMQSTEATLIPKPDVVCKLSNLNLMIAPIKKSLFLNFATAFFSSLEFTIPDISILKISSDAVDTDVLTLLKFPENLHFMSPRNSCNISCSDIISTIVLLSNQQIILKSQQKNISYKLDLSLLNHTPANISCEYGRSKLDPLTMLLTDPQPKSLVDIPDLRFDFSKIPTENAFVSFPDQWNSNIEDCSSKMELFHGSKNLWVQGKVVDDAYTTTPPTIFHSGSGDLYVNGILSTFKLKYCVCDSNMTDCTHSCSSYGTIIPFDQEAITTTIKYNPTRHISYYIFGSSPDYRPQFRLNDFSVKSFTLTGDANSFQYIDLEPQSAAPVVPLNHRFYYLSIRLISNSSLSNTMLVSFYNLEIQNSLFEDCSQAFIQKIGFTVDIVSAYALHKCKSTNPPKTLNIIGKKTLRKVVLTSLHSIYTEELNSSINAEFDLSQIESNSAPTISTAIGADRETMLRIELPGVQTNYEDIPKLKFDLTQLKGNNCYMLFPTSRWQGDLANLTEKITVEFGRHDFFEESTKHDDKYDGIPPLLKTVGSGRYYINGKLVDDFVPKPTPRATDRLFKSLGPSEIAGIVVGSCAFIVLVLGIIIFVIQKKKKIRMKEEESVSKIAALVDNFSTDSD